MSSSSITPRRWTIPVCSGCGTPATTDCLCPPRADSRDIPTLVMPVSEYEEVMREGLRWRRHAEHLAEAAQDVLEAWDAEKPETYRSVRMQALRTALEAHDE